MLKTVNHINDNLEKSESDSDSNGQESDIDNEELIKKYIF